MIKHILKMIRIIGAWIDHHACRSIRGADDPCVRADIGKRRGVVRKDAICILADLPAGPTIHCSHQPITLLNTNAPSDLRAGDGYT